MEIHSEDNINVTFDIKSAEGEVRKRIAKALKEFRTTYTAIAGSGTAMQSKFQRALSGSSVSISVVLYMLNKFPNLSTEWLLRGDGDMRIDNSIEDVSYKESNTQARAKTLEMEADMIKAEKPSPTNGMSVFSGPNNASTTDALLKMQERLIELQDDYIRLVKSKIGEQIFIPTDKDNDL